MSQGADKSVIVNQWAYHAINTISKWADELAINVS